MRIRRLVFIAFFLSSSLFAADPAWNDRLDSSSGARLFVLDELALVNQIDATSSAQISAKSTSDISPDNPLQFELPLPTGGSVKLVASEYSIMGSGVKAYGDFRSWKVKGVGNSAISGVIDISSNGFNAMLLMDDGETVFINPLATTVSSNQQNRTYKAFAKSNTQSEQKDIPFQCGVSGVQSTENTVSLKNEKKESTQSPVIAQRIARNLKTYRLAIAATVEFTHFYGSSAAAMNAISSIVNQLNFIYERDLGIKLELIPNNALIVFSNPDNDPYFTNSDISLLDVNTGVLNAFIGSLNYDIGHVLTRFTGSIGGVAELGSVCGLNKGGGVTGSVNPRAANFAIDFVAHEIGHQLGAFHTFNSTSGSCAGGNRVQASAFEPGSGLSVMSYAGICGVNNVISELNSNTALPVFHVGSILQIMNNVRVAGDCAIDTFSSNQDPEINTTTSITVNAGQSFTLSGSAVDPDGDPLTYSWDQTDTGAASDKFIDSGNNALFNVNLPSSSPTRVFPGTALTNRNLSFEFVVRDGKGGISSRTTTVNVVNGSPPVADFFPLSGLNSEGGSGAMDLRVFLFLLVVLLFSVSRKKTIKVKLSNKSENVNKYTLRK